VGELYRLVQQQSHLLAFMDVYEGLMVVALGATLLAFFMGGAKPGAARSGTRDV
jgi:hypothetical protein